MKKVVIFVFLMTTIAINSCKESYEKTYLGCWQDISNKNDYLTIITSGESFIIETKDGKLPGNMNGSIINLGLAGNIAFIKESHHLLFHDKEYLKIDDLPRTLSDLTQSRIDKFMAQLLGVWDAGGNYNTFLDIRIKDSKIVVYIISSQGELEGTAECRINFDKESLEGFGIDKPFDFSILESKKENGEFAGSISAYSNKLWGGEPLILEKAKNSNIKFENIKRSVFEGEWIGDWVNNPNDPIKNPWIRMRIVKDLNNYREIHKMGEEIDASIPLQKYTIGHLKEGILHLGDPRTNYKFNDDNIKCIGKDLILYESGDGIIKLRRR